MRPIIIVLFLLILTGKSAFPARSEFDPSKIDKARLTQAMDRLARKYKIPDYAIGMVVDNNLWFTLNKNDENEGKNYLIGSCSKSFTALATMKLAGENKIDLDKPVKDYLPWFEMKNKSYTDKVTVRCLLNQKSGFERQFGFFDIKTDSASAYEKKLASYIKKIDVRFAPGTVFLYCNLNYVLLGLIIKHVTNQNYADYMTGSVLPDAGMIHTFFTIGENDRHNLIQPYQYLICNLPFKSHKYYYSDFLLPAGHISSNINDLTNYIRFMLNKTVTSTGDTILSKQAYDELTGMGQPGYAMGWFRFKYDSIDVITHSGLNENFSSSFSIYPLQGLGTVILCNANSLAFCSQVDQEIRSMIAGKPNRGIFPYEKIMRWVAFLLPIILLSGLIFNLIRWKRSGFRFGIPRKVMPHLRLLAGIVFSLVLLIAVTRVFQMFITNSIRYQPDIGWGLVLIAVFGVASSMVRYFGTFGKTSILTMKTIQARPIQA